MKRKKINESFKRKKVPLKWEIYSQSDIEMIDGFITEVRSAFAANNYPELPNYHRFSTDKNHTQIQGFAH